MFEMTIYGDDRWDAMPGMTALQDRFWSHGVGLHIERGCMVRNVVSNGACKASLGGS